MSHTIEEIREALAELLQVSPYKQGPGGGYSRSRPDHGPTNGVDFGDTHYYNWEYSRCMDCDSRPSSTWSQYPCQFNPEYRDEVRDLTEVQVAA